MRLKKARKEALQGVVNDYVAAGEPWPAEMRSVAEWAIRTGHADYSRQTRAQMLARELQTAAREEYHTDPQGRRVRTKHSFKEEVDGPEGKVQRTFWGDMHTLTPERMRRSFQHRRRGIVGDCKQLKNDVDSFNDNNGHGAHIQLSLNFYPDVVELEEDTEYNPPPHEDSSEEPPIE